MVTLCIIIVYVMIGCIYTIIAVASEGWDWDIGQGWVPPQYAYPLAILLWPRWLLGRIFK